MLENKRAKALQTWGFCFLFLFRRAKKWVKNLCWAVRQAHCTTCRSKKSGEATQFIFTLFIIFNSSASSLRVFSVQVVLFLGLQKVVFKKVINNLIFLLYGLLCGAFGLFWFFCFFAPPHPLLKAAGACFLGVFFLSFFVLFFVVFFFLFFWFCSVSVGNWGFQRFLFVLYDWCGS